MIRTALTAAVFATMTAASQLAVAATPGVPDFASLDADGDGTLTESEWMDAPGVSAMGEEMAAAHYEMYDVDDDGEVSGDEYATVNEQTFEQMEQEEAI